MVFGLMRLTFAYRPQQYDGMVSITKATHEIKMSVSVSKKRKYATVDELGSPSAFHT